MLRLRLLVLSVSVQNFVALALEDEALVTVDVAVLTACRQLKQYHEYCDPEPGNLINSAMYDLTLRVARVETLHALITPDILNLKPSLTSANAGGSSKSLGVTESAFRVWNVYFQNILSTRIINVSIQRQPAPYIPVVLTSMFGRM